MNDIAQTIQLVVDNKDTIMAILGMIIKVCAFVVLIASIIIRSLPTFKEDSSLKPIVKLVGKYLALDRYGPKGDTK